MRADIKLILLAACLGMAVDAAPAASAAKNSSDDAPFVVTIPDDLRGGVGEEVAVHLNITDTGEVTNFSAFQFLIRFDPAVVTYIDVEHEGTMAEALGKPLANLVGEGLLSFGASFSGADRIELAVSPPELTRLIFRVIGNVGDVTNFEFNLAELSDVDGNAHRGETHAGKLRVVAAARDSLIVEEKIVIPGAEQQLLPVRLQNISTICGIQFTLKYDLQKLHFRNILLADRTTGWEIEQHARGDSVNAVLFHIPNDSLTAGSEAILDLVFDIRSSAPLGDTTRVVVSRALASDCDGNLIPLNTRDGRFVFGRKGDLNADGNIDLLDLDLLADIIVGRQQATAFMRWAGDLNNDGILDIRDIILLNNLIGGSTMPQAIAQIDASGQSAFTLFWSDAIGANSTRARALRARIAGNIKGAQVELRNELFKQGLAPIIGQFQHESVRIIYGVQGETCTLLLYGIDDALLPADEMELLRFAWRSEAADPIDIHAQRVADAAGNELFVTTDVQALQDNVPGSFRLLQNHPNPFRRITAFQVELYKPGDLDIVVYDLMGRTVARFAREGLRPGIHRIQWDGTDLQGLRIAAGIYYYRAKFESSEITRSLLILP